MKFVNVSDECCEMYFIIVFSVVFGATVGDPAVVRNFTGEPDYQKVTLHWEAEASTIPKSGFNVSYCNLQSWWVPTCSSKEVHQPLDENNIEGDDKYKTFSTEIKGLRMATMYTFEIKGIKVGAEKGVRENEAGGDDKNRNIILISTKGFSAKATRCLPRTSEIEVSTGPFFGGRIGVQAADGGRCAIDGDADSPQETYTLRINHTECGSQVNETAVTTSVIVQRHTLSDTVTLITVSCSYLPETSTVRAGISLPTADRGQAEIAAPYDDDNSLARRSRKSRAIQKPEAFVVRNLMGEPDYRQVRLHWETEASTIPESGFNVRYCELQTWGTQRCRSQEINRPLDENNVETDEEYKTFSTEIKGLRMATTYSFEVKGVKVGVDKGEREDRADGDDNNQNIIVIPTKGFSAKATQCLPHASEIEVSTGPFFGGRIAVEAADGERCAIDGEPDSPRDTYTLRINHTECGSQVNETAVATFVLVQENLPILTHSTRRFLVLCSYQPETLTVRAGISLPTAGRGHAQIAAPYDDDNSLARRSRMSRVLQKPEALVKEEIDQTTAQVSYKNNIVPIFVITMLVIAGVIGIVAIALKIAGKKIEEDLDNISIASEISTSSSSTVTELEAGCETKNRNSCNK